MTLFGADFDEQNDVTPTIYLETSFLFDRPHRIKSTREPEPTPGPIFTLVRSALNCVWGIRVDVDAGLAADLNRLAKEEPPLRNPQDSPLHADTYRRLLGGQIECGPAFSFPNELPISADVRPVDSLQLLERNFRGWKAGDIDGRSPILAIFKDGYPVSICFCARRSEMAAEAGVETVEAFRGNGFAAQVTAAWASAIRSSGRLPLYSTSWTNAASLAVARKLHLIQYAAHWSLL